MIRTSPGRNLISPITFSWLLNITVETATVGEVKLAIHVGT